MSDESAQPKGLYNKFHVTRNDGRDKPGGDRYQSDYFVLDLTHDHHAVIALAAYAEAVGTEYPELADDLWCKIFQIRGRRGLRDKGNHDE
jgi:hypothetical protein